MLVLQIILYAVHEKDVAYTHIVHNIKSDYFEATTSHLRYKQDVILNKIRPSENKKKKCMP